MKFFQKRWVAITLCILMIVVAIGIGQAKADRNSYKPESTAAAEKWGRENHAAYTKFLWDDGNLLSDKTEETLCAYNGALDYSYERICGIATVSSLDGENVEDSAFDLAVKMGLGEGDCLLLVDAETQDWGFVYGNDFGYYAESSGTLDLLLREKLSSAVTDPNRQLPEFFEALSGWYQDIMPVSGQVVEGGHNGLVAGGAIFFVFLVVFLIVVAIVSAIIRASRRVIGGFRSWPPLFFFGPGPRRPRPPFGPGTGPGPRPRPNPGPNPGQRPSSSNRSGGFSGSGRSSSSRGGSFGSGGRSGGFSSSSRGGSFGGRKR